MAEKLVKDSQGLAKDLVNDCISRKAAIDALENIDCSDGIGISALKCDVVEDAINAINALPSAQPEITLESAIDYLHSIGWMQEHDRVLTESAHPDSLVRSSARWVSVGHKRARICSRCFSDEPYKFADHDADVYDFCPHCGAKMEVDDGSD